ncbi:NXPE family member 3-like [Corticium candelabrum]|uniref:NXPE family member 3-like n=1 Tax=Corticium candelabrum TaxID=121492 RepID=UPI002E276FDC|nr:NXPE family member 3-like [Corticium candelabrum]XP_062523520.1 NXPE family member 3-like [Corticium candelabrum]
MKVIRLLLVFSAAAAAVIIFVVYGLGSRRGMSSYEPIYDHRLPQSAKELVAVQQRGQQQQQQQQQPNTAPIIALPSTPLIEIDTKTETSAKRSFWSVSNTRIYEDRPFHVTVTTRDTQGNKKTHGGDFIIATLVREKSRGVESASVSGVVSDLNNGSYVITFVCPWSGTATIVVKMWLTDRIVQICRSHLDANYAFLCTFGDSLGINVNFHGEMKREDLLRVQSMKAKRQGLGICHMDAQPNIPWRSDKTCEMRFPSKYHWYGVCDGPRAGQSKECVPVQWCVYDDSMKARNKKESKESSNAGIIYGNTKSVTIIKGDRSEGKASGIEPCKPQPVVRPKGYWLGKQWINTDCLFSCNTIEKWRDCLSGKDLYLIGASTFRQLYTSVLEGFGVRMPWLFIPSWDFNKFFKQYNASVRYRTHGLPQMTKTAMNFSASVFTADHIDKLEGNGNEIVVISLVHHFVDLTPDGFRKRMEDILDAIRRLKRRNKGNKIPIVFRADNGRSFDSFHINAFRIRWYNQIATDVIKAANLGIIVYDIFDMVAACPNPEPVHQADYVTSVQVSHILSLVCSN